MFSSIGIFGVLGNSFAIFILSHSSSIRKKPVNVFLINQSTVDLVTSTLIIFIGYIKDDSVIVTLSDSQTDVFCKLIGSRLPLWCLMLSSTWNLVFVNIKRLLSVKFPIFHKTRITRRHVYGIVANLLLLGVVVKFPMVSMTSGYKFGRCFTIILWPSKTAAVTTGLFNVSIQFLVPLLIMILCYLFMIGSIR